MVFQLPLAVIVSQIDIAKAGNCFLSNFVAHYARKSTLGCIFYCNDSGSPSPEKESLRSTVIRDVATGGLWEHWLPHFGR